ncbi:MAG: type III glutamate--ammonia ligase [Pseudomonadota bacterium]|nr:type III glutamate--ammonia ligase [Pseudomonadota bacterium]
MANLSDIARKKGIKYFLISFTDLFGVMRSKLVPASAVGGMQKNGAGFAGFATHLDLTPADPDMFAIPDADSLMRLPWKKEVAWVASDLIIGGKPLAHAPRHVLKRVTAQAAKAGYTLKTGVECEFFLLSNSRESADPMPPAGKKQKKKTASRSHGDDEIADKFDTQAKPCYDQLALMRQYDFISELCDAMQALGWEPYQNDHEDGNGQFEMNWGYADALTTADRHAFFKFMAHTLAEARGLRVTFMPKPFSGLTGNGCHMHFSLWDKPGGKNLFVDAKGELGLSKLAYHFLGGVLNEASALCAITNPTVNSYKRINAPVTASGATWSPNTISYTGNNRTHMVRIPDSDRFEIRLPDGAVNPYLLPAVVLAAGVEGIRSKASPGKRIDTNMYAHPDAKVKKLPQTLYEALLLLERSDALKTALGNEFVESYLKLKRAEWGRYLGQVSAWEREVYLDV